MQPTGTPKEPKLPELRPIAGKHNPRRTVIFIVLGIVFLFLLILGAGASIFAYVISTPVNKLDDSASLIEIKKGESVVDIARTLSDKRLIRDQNAFIVYAKLGPAHGYLTAGTYELKPSQTTIQMVGLIHAGKIASRTIPIREGLNINEMAAQVKLSGFATAESFIAATKDQYDNKILSVRPAGTTSLEGLLAPGTYTMIINQTPHALVSQMLEHFDATTAQYQNQKAPQDLTFYQALTLASLVELEAGNAEDRKLIAGVFYNRLKAGMKLQTDTSIGYAVGHKNVTATDTNVDSPYNTYKFAGLPPTPICSPGLTALDAVYNPTPSNYLFFIGGNDGKVHYATTYAEHQANIAKYLP